VPCPGYSGVFQRANAGHGMKVKPMDLVVFCSIMTEHSKKAKTISLFWCM
jgi:hypothetical protein